MENVIGKNILALRKELGLTQEALARAVQVSPQAVSRWENGNTTPDLAVLPGLANVLRCSIDALLGYAAEQRLISEYEERYRDPEYYWGLQPSYMCFKVLELCPPTRPLRLLDAACGEGKNAVFFARNGYSVTAFDLSLSGMDKARRLADKLGLDINFFRANMLDFRLDRPFDVIFCSGALHYVPPALRGELLENYQANTNEGGLHALNVFVRKPFVHAPSDDKPNRYKWISGELFTHYADWLIAGCEETIFDDMSGGVPHQHCMDTLYAVKKE